METKLKTALVVGVATALFEGGHYQTNQVVRVTRDDGSTTSAYDLSTTHDGFYSEFMDPVEVPEALRGLPNIAGMGRLRDLREGSISGNRSNGLPTPGYTGQRCDRLKEKS